MTNLTAALVDALQRAVLAEHGGGRGPMSEHDPVLRRDRLDVKAMQQRFGQYWQAPQPWGEDAWWFFGPGGMKVIVSLDPDSEPGVDWVHASMSYELDYRYPSYADLKRMHHGVFGDGHAYQVFVPSGEHINIKDNVLHLWGRLDGDPVLPNFGRFGTI